MSYSSINIQGNIVSSEVLDKIRNQDDYRYQKAGDFALDKNTRLRDEIGMAWAIIRSQWQTFQLRKQRLKDEDSGTSETRAYWMVPLLQELGYRAEKSNAELVNEKSYAISHRSVNCDGFPLHIVGINDSLDKRRESGGPRLSPHALVQEYLNNTEHLYALVTNGRYLRLLRDATRLVRLSYLEFDLEKMMEEELYAEFALLYRLLHVSRMPRQMDDAENSFIEYYHQESLASGSRIRNKLSEAVEDSLKVLANGFITQAANNDLRERIAKEQLKAKDYYLHLLRTIYRVLFIMVTEERQLVYPKLDDADMQRKRKIYYRFYSLNRLRKLAGRRLFVDANKYDIWESLKATFLLFVNEQYGKKLGISPLGSGLFAADALGELPNYRLSNKALLRVIKNLTLFENENQQLVRVNYGDLDVEEFGSVYEGLLELEPVFKEVNGQQTFTFIEGTGRSSSGSHYTPEELVRPLIKHSLDYIIVDKLKVPPSATGKVKQTLKEQQLLSIKVADVACGSGHILLNAARRIATELARVRTGEDQPTPKAMRKATRDAIKHCIYGVDYNPLAIELCKVALWLEAHNPGEPLNFLDHHIKCGNSIVGLAHREELENGIANEAFKTLPGDEKHVAQAFAKRNRMERKEREDKEKALQRKAEFEKTTANSVQEAMAEYKNFNKLPESTPNEIAPKVKAYKKFLDGKGYNFLKAMADTQVAQFFMPKTTENKEKLMSDAEFRLILSGYQGWQDRKTAAATVIALQKRFFHWFLEFPQVFQNGGFDCILGNPPYLGGKKISGKYGNQFLEFVHYLYSGVKGQADLITYFVRRIHEVSEKYFSLITTNSVCEGDTRIGGLEFLLSKNNGRIIFAHRSTKEML